MFLFWVIVGAGLVIGLLWLLRQGGPVSPPPELVARQATREIHDVERAAILRMLDEAQVRRQEES